MRRGAFVRREPAELAIPEEIDLPQVIQLIESAVSAESVMSRRPAAVQVKGARAMALKELEATLHDKRYRHCRSLEKLNEYMDGLRADRGEVRR